MLRAVRPVGWLALGRQSWRAVSRAGHAGPLEASAVAYEGTPMAPIRAWGSAAAPPTPSLFERLGLGQQAEGVSPAMGGAWVRRYSMPTTPLLERETIAYMRSVRTGSEVYLIGTAHVSKASAEEVKEVSTTRCIAWGGGMLATKVTPLISSLIMRSSKRCKIGVKRGAQSPDF